MCPSVNPTDFPNLTAVNHKDTSPIDRRYNCIAYAAGETTKWWWPDAMGIGAWPAAVERRETLAAFVHAYETLGYALCTDGAFEPGFEKIALYAAGRLGDEPTHAARQLANGKWTSKLGALEDIEHDDVSVVAGALYGSAVRYLRRLL